MKRVIMMTKPSGPTSMGRRAFPGDLPPPGEALDFIPVSAIVESENSEAQLSHEHYWQQHVGKSNIMRAIRGFLLRGKVKYGGRWIATRHDLTRSFHSKLIIAAEKKMEEERTFWYKSSALQQPLKATPRAQRKKGRSTISTISYNIASAHGERLGEVLHQYCDTDVIFLQGTCLNAYKNKISHILQRRAHEENFHAWVFTSYHGDT